MSDPVKLDLQERSMNPSPRSEQQRALEIRAPVGRGEDKAEAGRLGACGLPLATSRGIPGAAREDAQGGAERVAGRV